MSHSVLYLEFEKRRTWFYMLLYGRGLLSVSDQVHFVARLMQPWNEDYDWKNWSNEKTVNSRTSSVERGTKLFSGKLICLNTNLNVLWITRSYTIDLKTCFKVEKIVFQTLFFNVPGVPKVVNESKLEFIRTFLSNKSEILYRWQQNFGVFFPIASTNI